MDRIQLNAIPRQQTGKGVARKIRAQGGIPAILYGQGQDPMLLSVNAKELVKSVSSSAGLNALLDLDIQGQGKIAVMVRDYQADVLDRNFLHVDFLKIDLTKKVSVEVPIQLTGKSPGVKDGGILEHITRSIKVICLPTAIPKAIEVDVSNLKIGDNLHAHEIQLPPGVEMSLAADETIAAVVAPVEEKVEVAPTEVQQPEVTGQKKAGEEAATAAAKPAGGKEEKKKEEKK